MASRIVSETGGADLADGAVRRFVRHILPPPEWRLLVSLAAAVFVGLLLLVAHVSRATSYLSDSPTTCVNCHVMAPQYASWFQSAHRPVATCTDCHVPHDSVVRHYLFKAMDGARHATIFTLRLEPQVIRIKPMGQRAVQENCIRCHEGFVHRTSLVHVRGDDAAHRDGLRCWECHRETPHGAVRSLAALPYEHVPLPEPIGPAWLRRLLSSPSEPPVKEQRP